MNSGARPVGCAPHPRRGNLGVPGLVERDELGAVGLFADALDQLDLEFEPRLVPFFIHDDLLEQRA